MSGILNNIYERAEKQIMHEALANGTMDDAVDELAVETFTKQMLARMQEKRKGGKRKWWTGDFNEEILEQFMDAVERGDAINIANYAMMIDLLGINKKEVRRVFIEKLAYVAEHDLGMRKPAKARKS
jgi:hypothetical protein